MDKQSIITLTLTLEELDQIWKSVVIALRAEEETVFRSESYSKSYPEDEYWKECKRKAQGQIEKLNRLGNEIWRAKRIAEQEATP